MLAHISENQMHRVRWVLTCAWILLIVSLFYDPISPLITVASQTWSPLRIRPENCVQVQTGCLEVQPYSLGVSVFWRIVVPSSIVILLVSGHELWRRICPLSFLSQIPRALGWQRQIKKVDSKSGKERYELAKVKKDSWLGKNYLYLQFGFLFVGLCARILIINANAIALGIWLVGTIAAAITVGYLYGGKTWCNYFCPMAPVQRVFAEPAGLLTSKAHTSETSITQSMCRAIAPDGKEQSACVACQNPCIDIDSERSYWDGIEKPESKFLYYCYLGLVVGYFFYFYLYAGSWNYLVTGAWAMEANLGQRLMDTGFYVYGQVIPIPRILAVPLTLLVFSGGGYVFGTLAERVYHSYLRFRRQKADLILIRHHLFKFSAFIAFNIFFIFTGRPFTNLLPDFWQELTDVSVILLSTLWLYHTLRRDSELYAREGLVGRFRKQLVKMDFPLAQYFGNKNIEDLNPHEVYVLAKVLPGFNKQKRYEAYKGVLRDALEEGYANSSSSLEVLRQLRSELDISDSDHRTLLDELGIEDPKLLDPNRKRDLENLVRISGYQKALERLVNVQNLDVSEIGAAAKEIGKSYNITPKEAAEIIRGFDQQATIKEKSNFYLDRLQNFIRFNHSLNQSFLYPQREVVSLILQVIRRKQEMLVVAILEVIITLGEDEGKEVAIALGNLSPKMLLDILADAASQWDRRLTPEILALLRQPQEANSCSLEVKIPEVTEYLQTLLEEPNPVIQAASLYLLQYLDFTWGHVWAGGIDSTHPLLVETTKSILDVGQSSSLANFATLEKVVYLFNSDFFHALDYETLIELANRGYVKSFKVGEYISEAGDTCRELLLLIEGGAEIRLQRFDRTEVISDMLPGMILDELEVLTHNNLRGAIAAQTTPTRVLAIPVDSFDDLMESDRKLARKVVELESKRLKTLLERR